MSSPVESLLSGFLLALLSILVTSGPCWQVSGARRHTSKQDAHQVWLSDAGHGKVSRDRYQASSDDSQFSRRQSLERRQYLNEIPCGTDKLPQFQRSQTRSKGYRRGGARLRQGDNYFDDPDQTKSSMRNLRALNSERVFNNDHSFFMAMLRFAPPDSSETYCSGVLISDRHVLTAAHCLASCDDGEQTIMAASSVTASLGKNYERWDYGLPTNFSQLTVHPNFMICDPDYSFDIAVLQMSEPIVFSRQVNRICLPATESQTANLWARFYGYGLMSSLNDGYSQWRRLNSASYFVADKCEQYPLRFTGTMLCSVSGSHPCQGDSGGPLVVRGWNNVATLIGLNSVTGVDFTKHTDCNPIDPFRPANYRARFVSIKFLIDWIGLMLEEKPIEPTTTSTTTTSTSTTAKPTKDPDAEE